MWARGEAEVLSPRQRPRSPAVLAGCARCAQLLTLRESRRSRSNRRSYPSLICLLLKRRVTTFPPAARRLTQIHTHTSSVHSLPPSLLLSGERQLDGTVHLQESSLRRVLLQFPGSQVLGLRRARVAGEVRDRTEKRFRARCPPPSRRWSCSVQAGACVPAFSR